MPYPRKHFIRTSSLMLSLLIPTLSYTAITQAQAPVGHWTFDSNSGTTAADSSGNGHTATLVNGVTWVAGKLGYAVQANATSDQYIKIPTIDLTGTKAVTVTFWSKRTYSTNGGHILLEDSGNYNNSTTGFGFFPDDADCQGIQASVHGNVGYSAVCFKQPTSNVWHHFAVVYDKSKTGINEVTLYIDGVLQTPTGSTFVSDNTNSFGKNPIYLFARSGTSQFDSGALDDLALYNTALTAAQVQQIYQPTTIASGCQLVATPSSIAFPTTALGTSSASSGSLLNNCSSTITVTSAATSGVPYSISGMTLPLSISPGATVSYTALFAPAAAGTASGSIKFANNATASPAVSVVLTGTGVVTTQGTLAANPGAPNFGNVTINTSGSQAVTITNTGASAVTVSAVNVAGLGFTRSSVSVPLTLSPSQSLPLTVGFAPTTVGAATGSLTVLSNAQNGSFTVPLIGNGAAHSVTLAWAGNGATIAGYNVYRSAVASGSYTKVNSAPLTSPTFTDEAVTPGAAYYYTVTAVSTGGLESGYSNQATVTVP
jgi:hypothetical protein